MNRTILHCDCNGFYASVECILNPELRKVPMAVSGNPENRHGIILAKNELAKKYQIQTAETIQSALRKCPELTLVPPHHEEYKKYSKLVNEIYLCYTDLIEPFGIDESWLDVTGVLHIFGSGKEIADQLRQKVKEELDLTISVGVSFNKIFAKLGSDYQKPDATTVITQENYEKIIHPLPVSSLLYVGKKTKSILNAMHINTIGDLATGDIDRIIQKLGKAGQMLYHYANGIDLSRVRSFDAPEEAKSIGNGMTFKRNLVSPEDIKLGVMSLSDEVSYRLRKNQLKSNTISVLIKDPDFKTISRQKQLSTPTDLSKVIGEVAYELIMGCWDMGKSIRMITVTASNLIDENIAFGQISLFDHMNQDAQKQIRLENTLESIRDKFGKSAVKRGAVIKNDIGL